MYVSVYTNSGVLLESCHCNSGVNFGMCNKFTRGESPCTQLETFGIV
jgi:hypothetical protein